MNYSDSGHTVGDISTSGLDGHIAISGCPSMSHLWTLSLSLAWSKTVYRARITVILILQICSAMSP